MRRRRLGAVLREAREASGLTREHVAECMDISVSGVARWETGRSGIRVNDLRVLLNMYEVSDTVKRAELEQLAREGRQRGWWVPYTASIRPTFATFLGLEAEATELLSFSAVVLPGLLQTERYTRAVMHAAVPELSDATIDERAALRLRRQERLHGDPPMRLHAIIDESCLHRRVGGQEIWHEQLKHLLGMVEQRSITLQVLPFEIGAYVSVLGGFTVLRFADDPEIAVVELATGDLYADSDDAARYTLHFDRLREAALPPPLSVKMVGQMMDRG